MSQTILEEITAERKRQNDKWGEQNHPDFDPDYAIAWSRAGKSWNRSSYYFSCIDGEQQAHMSHLDEEGRMNWGDILKEELVEAYEADNTPDRRKELIQCAAVITQWIEAIDRRSNGIPNTV